MSTSSAFSDTAQQWFLDSVDEAVAAMPALLQLDRRQVRAVFEKRFSATRMARDYLAAYMRLIGVREAKAS